MQNRVGVFLSGPALAHLNLVPVGLEFIGHDHRQGRMGSLTHFRCAQRNGDFIVGRYHKPGVGI